MTLFGRPVSIWRKHCIVNGIPGDEVRPFVNLYIRVTDSCNASCPFCCNGGPQPHKRFDINKLEEVIAEIIKSGIRLNRVNITGGEISTHPEIAASCVELIGRMPGCGFTQVQIHTNGISPSARDLMSMDRVDKVMISLHHYDFNRLTEIYGCPVPCDLLDLSLNVKAKTSLRCNLIKGFIDTTDEVEKLIVFAASKGFRTIGFNGLMGLNDYSNERYVNPWSLDFDSIPSLLRYEDKSHEGACRCRNYRYTGTGFPVDVYIRETTDTDYCASSLLFDGEYLRQGFKDRNIIY